MMKRGAVIVDIAIDQGGCCETSNVTTHEEPVYIVDGIVHYCVGNMPGAVPHTSTLALNNATFKYARMMANYGFEKAIKMENGLANGVNIYAHKCVNRNVAESLDLEYTELSLVIA